jgi:NADH-ubiquinone oxidoreductase chain 1
MIKKLKMLSIISILEGLLLIVPALLSVAFVTIAERKTMASMQRRLGPNAVGYYGLLQAFADALKLLLKEYVAPTQANIILFFLGPMITLIFALLGYLVVPYGSGLFVSDYSLGMLYMLAVSSLATYGILLAGWSANSKYAFLGSLRSTAQLISYELILSSVILLVILLTGNLNMITIVESQRVVDFLLPLFPLFIIFFVGSIAETNRPPFDLAEAESELVSGFMTEHSASIFVFFFLAEYASIVLICVLNSILFLGGYLSIIPVDLIISILSYLGVDNSILEGLFINISSSPLNLGLKTILLVFVFIWVRASFPRIRFDQLMSVCWTVFLPLIIAYVVLLPCVVYGLDALPTQIVL